MILAILRTRIIENKDLPITEGGFFELEVQINEQTLQTSGDVKAYAYRVIGAHLASAVKDTEVPQDLWTVEFTERAQRRYGFPEFLKLDGTK